MAHWAEIDDDDVVLRVIRCDAEIVAGEESTETPAWITENLGGRWVRTWYDSPPHRYAGTGWTWRPDLGNFVEPQPYPSWTLDEQLVWRPPVPIPTDGDFYQWDEDAGDWVAQ